MNKKPVMLMILDGWGTAEKCASNAISQANPVNFYRLAREYPYTLLTASGMAVGLPEGQMGNSEVGHLNMGAGRVVYQDISRIGKSIQDGDFFENPVLNEALERAQSRNAALHLMGLVSDGGVHSHMDHIFALLKLCHDKGVDRVFLHAFLDGRDTDPQSGKEYVRQLQQKMQEMRVGQIASVQGRFYAMDRDNRWERVEKGYHVLAVGEGILSRDACAAIQNSYDAGVSDEFVEPVVLTDAEGHPLGPVKDNDSIIFFNFRADRAREISHAFMDKHFAHFTRKVHPQVFYVCMTQYDEELDAEVAFKPQNLNHTLGEVLAEKGFKQLRIAETEKYAHVTFFFNGGVEKPNPGEDRILIPSPAVETYDLKPEMSAVEVSERVLQEIDRDYYDFIILNFANPDMVGHTGNLTAAVQAVKTVDACMIRVVDRILQKGGSVVVTADHGNCEVMKCPETGGPLTAHTTNQVPCILVSDQYHNTQLQSGKSLEDIAPTLLALLGVTTPAEMTGSSLIISPVHQI